MNATTIPSHPLPNLISSLPKSNPFPSCLIPSHSIWCLPFHPFHLFSSLSIPFHPLSSLPNPFLSLSIPPLWSNFISGKTLVIAYLCRGPCTYFIWCIFYNLNLNFRNLYEWMIFWSEIVCNEMSSSFCEMVNKPLNMGFEACVNAHAAALKGTESFDLILFD